MNLTRDICFAAHDGHRLLGDFYRPETSGPVPVVLLVHGGGMKVGDKRDYDNWGRFFAGKGVAAFSINYRLLDHGPSVYPQNIWDVQAAVKYLRGEGRSLGLNGQIAAMGASSGAYLISMVALTSSDPDFVYPYTDNLYADESVALDAVVPTAGIYDMVEQWAHDQLHRPLDKVRERYLHGTPMDNRERYYTASPIFHASTEKATSTKWLIVWGTHDDVAPPVLNSERFFVHLKRAGALVRIVPVVGAVHFWEFESEVEDAGRFTAYLAPRVLSFFTTWCGWDVSAAPGEPVAAELR